MPRTAVLAVAALIAAVAAPAAADPVGRYAVAGSNPGMVQSTYGGTVEVTRQGETYSVVWEIGETVYVGTGIGATERGGRYLPGPASPRDTVLIVGYPDGVVTMLEGANGVYTGLWATFGEDALGEEVWTPLR